MFSFLDSSNMVTPLQMHGSELEIFVHFMTFELKHTAVNYADIDLL